MSVKGCIEYICRERGITERKHSNSKKIIIDAKLFDLEMQRMINECDSIDAFLTDQTKNASSEKRNQLSDAAKKSRFGKTWIGKA